MSLLPVKRVVVVTALHFGANKKNGWYFYSDFAKEESLKLLKDFERQTYEAGFSFDIVSNENVDKDICYMVGSSYFVTGISAFSDLIEQCRNYK